jgi:cell division transport system permease protein
VDRVREERETLRRMLSIFSVVRTVGLILGAFLALGAAGIIGNTIRVALFARRRDIRVMQLVGATNAFIRFPFVLEGVLAGAVGGGLACGAIAGSLHYYNTQVLPNLAIGSSLRPSLDFALVAAGLVAAGGLIGMVGSLFSLRRFLHAA